jgi:hypothetical protein
MFYSVSSTIHKLLSTCIYNIHNLPFLWFNNKVTFSLTKCKHREQIAVHPDSMYMYMWIKDIFNNKSHMHMVHVHVVKQTKWKVKFHSVCLYLEPNVDYLKNYIYSFKILMSSTNNHSFNWLFQVDNSIICSFCQILNREPVKSLWLLHL